MDGLKGTNVLVFDSGNALFRNAGVATAEDKTRAAFVLQMMERLGTKAMAVGQRDLSAGVGGLKALTAKSKVKPLSANLEQGGKPVFDASTIIDAGGVKVALVGLTAPGQVAPDGDVTATPTVEAAKAAIAKLGKRDVTVVLAATSYADAMQLSTALKGSADLVVQSGEFRGTVPPQRVEEGAPILLASGQRGQAMAKATVTLGTGSLVDLTVVAREREQLTFVDNQVKTLEDRIAKAKDKRAAADFGKMLGDLKARQKELLASISKKSPHGARTLDFTWVVLGSDVADDPAWKAEVLKIEPTYAGAH